MHFNRAASHLVSPSTSYNIQRNARFAAVQDQYDEWQEELLTWTLYTGPFTGPQHGGEEL